MLQRGIIRPAAQLISEAAHDVCRSLRETEIEQEPAFTERLLGRITAVLDGFRSHGVIWRAKTLTDRGPRAQETKIGADFLGVLQVDLPDERIGKGFLAQAKLAYPGEPLTIAEFSRLRSQAHEMLEHSPVSFVFGYSRATIIIVPAADLLDSAERDLHKYHTRGMARFFEEHFACFIGDPHLRVANSEQLDELLIEQRIRRGLLIAAVSALAR